MHFHPSEEQNAIVEMGQGFAADELAPFAVDWDQAKIFPVQTLRKAASLGLAAIYTREDFGGSGHKRQDAVMIFEALANGCPTIAAYISIHNMCVWMIDRYGSDHLRQKYVPQLATMDHLASYCLTEPGAGSDAGNLRTRAVCDGNDYVLTGEKQFISGAGTSDIYIVMSRSGDTGPRGISAFVVEKGMPGLSFER